MKHAMELKRFKCLKTTYQKNVKTSFACASTSLSLWTLECLSRMASMPAEKFIKFKTILINYLKKKLVINKMMQRIIAR